jgi:hypothetical protein
MHKLQKNDEESPRHNFGLENQSLVPGIYAGIGRLRVWEHRGLERSFFSCCKADIPG